MEKLYLDEDGYQRYQEKIALLRTKLHLISKQRKGAFDNGAVADGELLELDEIMRQESLIVAEIRNMTDRLNNFELVEKHNDVNKVDIGDNVSLDINFGDGEISSITVSLVNDIDKKGIDFTTISLSSPIGRAILGQQVGTEVIAMINGNCVPVFIKAKIVKDLEQGKSL